MLENKTFNSSRFPYEACLRPGVNEKLQHPLRDIVNYVVVPLQMLMAIMSLICNTLVFITVTSTTSLRHPTLLLLCSLAVTDVIWALFTLRLKTLIVLDPYMCPEFGEVTQAIFLLCLLATVSNLATISRDRYLAISSSLWYRCHMSRSRVVRTMLFNWILSASTSFLRSGIRKLEIPLARYFDGVVGLLQIVFILVVVFNYVRSLFAARRYSRTIPIEIRHLDAVAKREKKMSRMISAIILCFLFSFLPALIIPMILIVSKRPLVPFDSFCSLLFTLNGLLNPLVNFSGNKDIRRVMRNKFRCCHDVSRNDCDSNRNIGGGR